MAKIQLTIATEYVKGWNAWEGIREIVQNALDANDDGYAMTVTHSGNTLRVMSADARLKADVWLMGTSGKSAGGYRGHFGEGLKLGVLALVRAGHDVKIVNRDESWTPKLEESEVFGGRNVLTIHTRQREKDCGGFLVEISGVDKEAWAMIRPRFLALVPQAPGDVIDTYDAKVLTAPDMRGKVFVKGIFVQHQAELSAGYDFKTLETDRDRKMVDSFDLRYHAGRAWSEAMSRSLVTADKVLTMITSGAPDAAGIGTGYSGGGEQAVCKALAEAFVAKHGEGAMPVASMAEAREVEHYGKAGVVVPKSLVEALKNTRGLSLTTVREDFKRAAQTTYGWNDLTPDERATYTDVVGMVEAAAAELGHPPVEARLTVVDFGDEAINGLHEGGSIKIAKKLLADFDEALRVLVHEVAHDEGADGEKAHERAEGKLFARIVRNARQAKVVKAPVAPAPVAPAPALTVADALAVLADATATDAEIAAALALLA
jgi:hypothetical protein